MTKQTQVLQTIARRSATSNAFFHAIALKQRARAVTDVPRYAKIVQEVCGEKFNYDDYIATLKALADIEIGKIETGPRGAIKKFKWSFACTSVGSAGLEGNEVVRQAKRQQLPRFNGAFPAPKQVIPVKPKTPVDPVRDSILRLLNEVIQLTKALQYGE